MKNSALALVLLGLGACENKPADPTPAAATVASTTAAARNLIKVSPAVAAAVRAAAIPSATEPPPIPVGTKTKCPVSGEDFTVSGSTKQVVYAGKRYAFCCADCQPEFAKNPAKFAKN